jgi:hypothetical protein
MVAFAACAKEEEPPPVEEEEEEEEVWQWPERLLVTATGTTSPLYGAFIAWTTPLAEDTGMTVRIINEADVRLQELWVKSGEFFTKGPQQNRSMMYALRGWSRRDYGAWQSRVWQASGVSYWTFGALGNSGIKTPNDIKPGTKMVLITLAEEPQQMFLGLAAWAQVNPEDIVWVPSASTRALPRLLMDGKIDIALCYIAPNWLEVEASPHGLTYLPLDKENDPEGAERFLQWYPMTGFGACEGMGIPSAEGIPMAKTLIPYITSADTDSELVYHMCKWVDENYDRFKDGHPWTDDMTLDNLLELAEIHYEPLHDGAVRYLEEKGLWTAELEARRQYNIEQLTKWVDAYQTAIDMADERGINVDPENDEWQELWENHRDLQDLPLLVWFQNPGKAETPFWEFYEDFERIKTDVFKLE